LIDINQLDLCLRDRHFGACSASSSALLSECTHSRAISSVHAGGKNEFLCLEKMGNDKGLPEDGKMHEARRHFPIPEIWTTSQRRGLVAVFGVVAIVLAIRLWMNRATLPDPLPPRGSAVDQLADRLDPNTASASELAAIPTFGEKRAQAMVEYRRQFQAAHPGKAAFAVPDDLKHVRGIGPAVTETLEGYLIFPAESSTRP
jgi:hypothetical protein